MGSSISREELFMEFGVNKDLLNTGGVGHCRWRFKFLPEGLKCDGKYGN